MNFRKNLPLMATALLLAATLVSAKDERPPVKTVKLTDNIYMLMGQGGNVGLFGGEDGTLMIDDQYAPMTEKLLAAAKEVGLEAPRFLLNTHYHGDHTGGNENFGKAGTLIMAHDNVRKRLSAETFIEAFNAKNAPRSKEALPVITFTETLSLYINNESVSIIHIPLSHTDGDSIVFFHKANVLHTGDLFFNGFYPFIDVGNGGSLKGMIAASDKMLEMSNDETQIIPGHGPLASKADLQAYRDMMAEVQGILSKLRAEGKSLSEVLKAKPLAKLDEKWGGGFLNPEKFLSIIYPSL